MTSKVPGEAAAPGQEGRGATARLRLISSGELSGATAQTTGMIRAAARPGDYVWVPPQVPHREENPSADTEAVVVIARSTQEAIVVNLSGL